jgi:hypothetical protein
MPHDHFAQFAGRLKAFPFKADKSAAAEAVAFQNSFSTGVFPQSV